MRKYLFIGSLFTIIIVNYILNKKRKMITKDKVIEIVKKNGLKLRYIPDIYKLDKEVVLFAINQNPKSIIYSNKSIRNNSDIIFTLIKQNALLIKYLSNNSKSNKQVVITALLNNRDSITFVCNNLKYLYYLSNKELIKELKKYIYHQNLLIFNKKLNNDCINYISSFI